MIDRFREKIGISVRELEQFLLDELRETFSKALSECIDGIDKALTLMSYRSRLELKDIRERTLETTLGRK